MFLGIGVWWVWTLQPLAEGGLVTYPKLAPFAWSAAQIHPLELVMSCHCFLLPSDVGLLGSLEPGVKQTAYSNQSEVKDLGPCSTAPLPWTELFGPWTWAVLRPLYAQVQVEVQLTRQDDLFLILLRLSGLNKAVKYTFIWYDVYAACCCTYKWPDVWEGNENGKTTWKYVMVSCCFFSKNCYWNLLCAGKNIDFKK